MLKLSPEIPPPRTLNDGVSVDFEFVGNIGVTRV